MKKSYLLAAIAIFIWSTIPVVTKNLLASFTSLQIVSVSALFAAVFLLALNIATGRFKILRTYTLKDYVITTLIGAPGTFIYYIFLYIGTDKMLASQAFIINYLWPIMSIVFACIILKEKMTVRGAIAVALSFLGVVIVTGDNLLHFNQNTLIGAIFCILAAVSYGSFTALNKKYKYDKFLSMMISYAATFIFSFIINAATGNLFILTPAQTLGIIWNGVFSYAIGTTFWAIALDNGNTAKISNLAYITPFLAITWTSIFLPDDPFNPVSLLGLIVIVSGILIQLSQKKKNG